MGRMKELEGREEWRSAIAIVVAVDDQTRGNGEKANAKTNDSLALADQAVLATADQPAYTHHTHLSSMPLLVNRGQAAGVCDYGILRNEDQDRYSVVPQIRLAINTTSMCGQVTVLVEAESSILGHLALRRPTKGKLEHRPSTPS